MSGNENKAENFWLDSLFENRSSNATKYNEALVYVRQNFMKFYPNDLFLELDLETFCILLESDDLNVPNEEVVFDSVRRWIKFNNLDPNTYLMKVLGVVRLSLLPIEYLLNEVEPYVYPILNCRETFLDVLRYHLLDQNKINATIRKYQNISSGKTQTKPNQINLDCKTTQSKNDVSSLSSKSGPKLLSVGSDNLNTANVIEVFNESENRWINPKNVMINRRNYSVALIDNKVMLIGGTQSSNKDNEPLNMVQSLDLSTGILSTEASLNDDRQYAATVVVGKGKTSVLYVLGGLGKEKALDSVESWDPVSRIWIRAQSMPSKRVGLAAAFLNDKIYILGGRNGSIYMNTMEAYSLDDEEWETKASMKEARAHFCVTVFKGFLYAVAGSKGLNLHVNSVEKYNPYDDSWVSIANVLAVGNVGISSFGKRLICAGGKDSKSVLEYDEKNNKWSKLNDLKVSRAGYLLELPRKMNNLSFDWDVQITSHKLLSIGNQESDKAFKLEVYDDTEQQWTQLNDINIDKINYSMAYLDENILMIGGSTVDEKFQFNSVESLNLRTGKISQIAPLNVRRQHSTAVVVNQKKLAFIYVFGGMGNGKLLKSVERWDSSSRVWVFLSPMTSACRGHGSVLLQNEIYVIGGSIENVYNTTVSTVTVYDIDNDRWTSKASMNNAKAFFGITTFKNFIYVAGGKGDHGIPVNTVERYDPERNIWDTIANISSSGFVGISSLGNKLICAGGKSSNVVEEYDEEKNQWHKLTSLNVQSSVYLIELKPDVEKHWFNWKPVQKSSEKLVYLGSWFMESGNIIETFDVKENKWTRLKDLTLHRLEYGVNIINNKLLIIGGSDGKQRVDTVNAIDLSSGSMTTLPPLKVARAYPPSVVVKEGNKEVLYVVGGWGNQLNQINGDQLLASVEKWDPITNEWTEGIPMTSKRVGHGVVYLRDTIYSLGGRIESPYINTVEAFHIKGEVWESKASMRNTNAYFGITTFKDYIYIVGGLRQYGEPLNIFERYDTIENTWTTLANIMSSEGVGLCSVANRLICAGGTIDTVQEYDVSKDQWISLPAIHVARSGFLLELPENAKLS